MEGVIIAILVLVIIFLAFWIRNLIAIHKRAAMEVMRILDAVKYYSSNSLNELGTGNSMWMHDPSFKLFKHDTELIISILNDFRSHFFDAIEIKDEKQKEE